MDRLIAQNHVAPAAWASWLRAQASPLAETPVSRLVVVAPHPDDEVLMCGGLIQHHLSQGIDCHVIAVTDGEASHDSPGATAITALHDVRQRESRAGLDVLGVDSREVTRLGLPDGAVLRHGEQLRGHVRRLLRPIDRVVTTWRLDGHPDHEATAEAVAAACGELGCELLEAPVWMWHWARPAQPGMPWHRLHACALSPASLTRKRQALDCHRSQLAPRGPALGPVLDDAIVERALWPSEHFFVTHAP